MFDREMHLNHTNAHYTYLYTYCYFNICIYTVYTNLYCTYVFQLKLGKPLF